MTHAIGGAASAVLFTKDPLAAFLIGFASHFVLDAIPHSHYKLKSIMKDPSNGDAYRLTHNRENMIRDFLITGADCAIGTSVAFYAVWQSSPDLIGLAVMGIVAGVLPDFLQFVYYVFPNFLIGRFKKFHDFIHAKTNLDDSPLIGALFQSAIIVLLIFAILSR